MRLCKRMAALALALGLGVSVPGQAAWAKAPGASTVWDLSESGVASKNTGSAQVSQTGPSGDSQESASGAGPSGGGDNSSQVSLTSPSEDSEGSAGKPSGPTGGQAGSGQGSASGTGGTGTQPSQGPAGDTQNTGQASSGSTGGSENAGQASSGSTGGTQNTGQAPPSPTGGSGNAGQASSSPTGSAQGTGQAPPSPTGGTQNTGQESSGPTGGTQNAAQASSGPTGDSENAGQAPSGPTGSGQSSGQTSSGATQASDGPSSAGGNLPGGTGTDPQANAGNQAGAAVAQPEIKAEGAVVIDAATGNILFGKNETARFYPASTTKLMTAMLVLERTNLSDVVTFSKSATTNLESGASTLNLTEGDRLTVEQCLYGLLLKSANEIGNALAEHVSGSVSAFADLMNQRAAQLGCTGTHFANPHGLNDSNHYTTPYDMALIGRAAFQNQTLCKIDTTISYQFPATKKEAARTISMGHKMMYPSDSRYYEGIIGGKTGYTSLAGNTLVTGAQRGGVRLVAVVMKGKSTHYEDTKALLDYGFAVMARSEGGVSQSASIGWTKDDRGWIYTKQDGSRAAGEWVREGQTDYWIDPDGYMATGWRQFAGGEWYYFRSNGAKAVDYWVMDYGKWFYLGPQGTMLAGTRTADGYVLGADGAWIP